MSKITPILITYISVLLICIWAIDISVTSIMYSLTLTNGVIIQSPEIVYHISLTIIILSSIIMCFLMDYKFKNVRI